MTPAGNHEKLGEFIQIYRKSWTFPVVLLLIFLFPAYLFLQAGLNADDPITPLLSGFALFSPALYAIADRSSYRVSLYKNGVVKSSLFGKTVVYFDATTKIWYAAIQEFINGIPAGMHINIKIADANNSIKLRSSIVGIEHLRNEMVRIESNIICPALTVEYLKGKPIDFSVLKLNREHVLVKSKYLHVANITRMELQQGIFSIWQNHQRSAFCKIQASKIANLYTFLNILPAISPVGQPQCASQTP